MEKEFIHGLMTEMLFQSFCYHSFQNYSLTSGYFAFLHQIKKIIIYFFKNIYNIKIKDNFHIIVLDIYNIYINIYLFLIDVL